MADPDSRSAFLLGAAFVAAVTVMFGGAVLALWSVLSHDYVAAALSLLAVGASAGLVLNGYLRR